MTSSQVKFRRFAADEPTMSDNTLLLKLEDLIHLSFGPVDTNVVNLKMLQTILFTLARQMRVLEQDVEIRFADEDDMVKKIKQDILGIYSESSSEDGVEGGTDKGKKGGKGSKADKDGKATKGGKDKSDTKDSKEVKDGKGGKDGKDGKGGKDGKDGKDSKDGKGGKGAKGGKGGKDGRDGSDGRDGTDGTDGRDGKDVKGGKGSKGAKDVTDATDVTGATGGIDEIKGKKKGTEKRKDAVDYDGKTQKTGRRDSSLSDSDSHTRIGSIEVVTASKFNLLESMVKQLLKRTGGVPLPTMPSNEDLLGQLAKGTAKLPDTMEAMQVNARIRAAEEGLTKMAGLLTHLASSGALPPGVAGMVTQMQADLKQLSLGQQPAALKAGQTGGPAGGVAAGGMGAGGMAADGMAAGGMAAGGAAFGGFAQGGMPGALGMGPGGIGMAQGMGPGGPGGATGGADMRKYTMGTQTHVTHPQMNDALRMLREDLLNNAAEMTHKSDQSAVHATHLAKTVAEKMEVAAKLDDRISALNSLTEEYSKQLQGFDTSLKIQLDAFREQMAQLHNDLGGGIQQFESLNSNAESAALLDLKTTFDTLQRDMEQTMSSHGTIVVIQSRISDDLKGLVENIEMLRDQKADRDEVADGLRDKAKISRLNGFLREEAFHYACEELDARLSGAYDKFTKQNKVWMTALNELTETMQNKVSIMDLVSLRDYASKALNSQMDLLRKLEVTLGEPKAALLARQLARDAHCGACETPAIMEPYEPSLGEPYALPALRPPPEDRCITNAIEIARPEETRKHVCKRWVGGSHTLVSEHVTRERAAPPLDPSPPTRKYAGRGQDGRIYQMEEELKPCVECNKVSPTLPDGILPSSKDGGGDVA